MNRRDPRIQRTLDDITANLESFSTNAQTAAFSFTQEYINPCLASVSVCLDASCAPCIAFRRDRARARRQRHASRVSSRPELVFDFYNDAWEDEEGGGGGVNERTGLLGSWGADDLDRLLAGSGGGGDHQPRGHRQRMNYGSSGRNRPKGEPDPTVLPGSSMFGFLESLPWKIGGRGVRYKPSAADLQEGLGRKDREERRTEGERLLDDSDDGLGGRGEGPAYGKGRKVSHQRQRSGTVKSTDTENSLSSRGDLFPSDEEADAVPLDDEFAMALERRSTGDEPNSDRRSARSKLTRSFSGFTIGSKSTKSSRRKGKAEDRDSEVFSPGSEDKTPSSEVKMTLGEGKEESGVDERDGQNLPTMDQLREEEDQVREADEAEVQRKREEAQKVAIERGMLPESQGNEVNEYTEEDDAVLDGQKASTAIAAQERPDKDASGTEVPILPSSETSQEHLNSPSADESAKN